VCAPSDRGDLAEESSRTAIVTEVEGRGLTVDLLVNNAGFSTTGPVAGAVRDRELAMVRTDVEAVVDLCTLFVPAWSSGRRRRAQRRLDGRLPAAARPGRLRRLEGVRALLHESLAAS